jgi:Tfp pilus assembly protein PilF
MAAPLTQADKQRADAERNLKAAHGYLQRGNLSATKARLAAAITAQPDNRDARRMRAQVSTLEQQRDALLSLARGCSNVGHWECASHNANEALRIDSSSKAAQRLVALASQESAWQTMQPTAEESRALRDLLRHH